jgi:hypothetical protein
VLRGAAIVRRHDGDPVLSICRPRGNTQNIGNEFQTMGAKGWQRHRVDDEASASTLAAPPVSSPVANPQAVSWVTLLGQAATLITLATALIFLAGNFVLYTRSYFERFPGTHSCRSFRSRIFSS